MDRLVEAADLERTVRFASMQVQVQDTRLKIAQNRLESSPENTQKQYAKYIAEWKEFWNVHMSGEKDESFRYVVSPAKALLFLSKKASTGRGSRGRKRKRAEHETGEKPGSEETVPCSYSVLNAMRCAIVSLWELQQAKGVNQFPHPIDQFGKNLLDQKKLEEAKLKRSDPRNLDHGTGTIADCYSQEELESMVRYCWSSAVTASRGMRTNMLVLLSHFAMMRGEVAREARLANLVCVRIKFTNTASLRFIALNYFGKTATRRTKPYVAGFIRHVDVQLCPVQALAFSLFQRWHLDGEPVPLFQKPDWRTIKLYTREPGSAKTKASNISEDTMRQDMKQILEACNINSSKVTHIMRKAGSQIAEFLGVPLDDIKRIGKWNEGTAEQVYLTGIPLNSIAKFAGHTGGTPSYRVLREELDPPEDLVKLIFPVAMKPSECKDVDAAGFLRVLDFLRVVILQDAVFLKELHPQHPIWKQAVFSSPIFARYETLLKKACSDASKIEESKLENVVPEIVQYMAKRDEVLLSKFDAKFQTITMGVGEALKTAEDTFQKVTTMNNSHHPAQQSNLVTAQTVVRDQHEATASALPIVLVDTTSRIQSDSQVFQLSRSIKSVEELHQEWFIGTALKESVISREKYDQSWRKLEPEKRYYKRRMVIIRAIQKDGLDSIVKLQAENNFSLDKLTKFLSQSKPSLN